MEKLLAKMMLPLKDLDAIQLNGAVVDVVGVVDGGGVVVVVVNYSRKERLRRWC